MEKMGEKFTHAQSQTGEQQHHDGGPCGMGIRIFENQYKVEEQMNADLETNNWRARMCVLAWHAWLSLEHIEQRKYRIRTRESQQVWKIPTGKEMQAYISGVIGIYELKRT